MVNHYAREGRHYALARQLTKRGHIVTVISSSYRARFKVDVLERVNRAWDRETRDGITLFYLRTPPYEGNSLGRIRNMLAFSWRLLRQVGIDTLDDPDVIIGSSPHPFAALASLFVARKKKVPFVLEIRDLWPQSLIDIGGLSRYNPGIIGLSLIERYLYRHAARIITLMPGGRDYIANAGGNESAIYWLPNGVDLELIPEPTEISERPYFTVMYAGAHGLANSLDTVLECAAILNKTHSRVRFRFIGDGPEKRRLMAYAQDMRLSNVDFEPPVPKAEIFSKLAEADAFVLPLKKASVFRYGVSPNKLFDYLASARPVVFAVDAGNDPVSECRAGIAVPPEDPEAMAAAIVRLAEMPVAERAAMGVRGRAYVRDNHDFARLSVRLEEILKGAVDAD